MAAATKPPAGGPHGAGSAPTSGGTPGNLGGAPSASTPGPTDGPGAATGGTPGGMDASPSAAGRVHPHVIRSFTLRNLVKNRARSIVNIIGIALSCALLTAVMLSVGSLISYMRDSEVAYDGAWLASAMTTDEGAIEALFPERVLLMPDCDEDLWSDDYLDLVTEE